MKTNFSIVPRVLFQNPKLAIQFFSAFRKIVRSFLFDRIFRKGKASNLALITMRITPLCNLTCKMCGQRGEQGTLKGSKAAEENKKIVPIETYEKMFEELKKTTRIVYVWGGEPFLYPNFMDLAGIIVKKIPALSVNTNGTFLKENAERIVRDGWQTIFVSLDSFEEINDGIRGKDVYRKAVEGIEAVLAEKKKQKSTLPYVGIVTTVSKMNYKHLLAFAKDVSRLDLAWHIINLGTYMDETLGMEHEKQVQEKLGYTPHLWKGFATGLNRDIDGEEFSQILKSVHDLKVKYPIITVPVIDPSFIGKYYSDLGSIVRDQCLMPWFSTDINYDGEVNFCADYHDYTLGNIKDKSILEIYNGPEAVKYRNTLKDSPDGIFPACRRCYQLMLCGRRRK